MTKPGRVFTEQVATIVTPDLLARIRQAAAQEGRSVAAWVRLTIERALGTQQ
jgi:hypothetical protein